MTKTVLLTIGRLPKALDLARALAGAGCRVIVAEPFRWHLTRMSKAVAKTFVVPTPVDSAAAYLDGLRTIVEQEHVDLVVPVSEETMYVAALRDTLGATVAVYCMPQPLVLKLHNKFEFNAFAASLGLGVPETYRLGDARSRDLAAAGDTIVKPVYSCSGRGVRFFKAGETRPAPDVRNPEIVQQRLYGQLYSTFAVANAGELLINAVYRAAVLSGSVAVCFERLIEQKAVTDWVTAFVRKTGYSGFISFDFIVDPSGLAFAIECNPRVTSGIHFVNLEDLAKAILVPGTLSTIRYREETLMQQVFPCLTETQSSLFDWPRFKSNLGYLVRAKDVTWRLRDPWPFVTMPLTASQIIARAIRYKQSFGEASTYDISWTGHDPAAKSGT